MIQSRIPKSYQDFHCIASLCPDTCCQQWDIDIDPETYARYQVLSGPLGEKVRTHLKEGEEGPIIALEDGQCPMHRRDGLCALQAELGEEALCQVCREFPRLRHDYGDFVELGLELSCPEAARLILTEGPGTMAILELPGEGKPDYDRQVMALLLSSRQQALEILNSDRPLMEALTLVFFYGCNSQEALDGEADLAFSPKDVLSSAADFSSPQSLSQVRAFFLGLDILTEDWKQRLSQLGMPRLTPEIRNLARYLIGRYWLQAVSDFDLYSRVKFILISCLLVAGLPGDRIDSAHLWSKEIENDWENMDAILDAAYEDPVFTDARIVGWLRGAREN